jgi:hypothetical protein
MRSEVNIPRDEWKNWAVYHAKLFPTAPPEMLDAMVKRMVRTLSFDGHPSRMTAEDYMGRLLETEQSLEAIPDDSIQGGGWG